MQDWDWQLLLAVLAVVVAAFVLIRRAITWVRGDPTADCSSGACGTCPAGDRSQQTGKRLRPTFVPLDPLETRDEENAKQE